MRPEPETWLILSYLFNIDGKAASLTITDRIPLLLAEGVRPVVLSGPIGGQDSRFPHWRVFSPLPSGLQYELRFLLKKNKTMRNWLRELLKTSVSIVFLPFYLIERTIIHLDTHWSWAISGFVAGLLCLRRHRLRLIYSTAGPSSTHLAAYFLHRLSGLPWIAELHDPLLYDLEPRKWHQRYLFNRWLEGQICRHADAVIYFTDHALVSAERRHPIRGLKAVLRPGAAPPDAAEAQYRRREKIHFGHFGSLASTRNLSRLIEALHLLLTEQPAWRKHLVLDIYGSGLDEVSQKALAVFPLDGILVEHGRLEHDPATGKSGRQQAFAAMKQSDVLVVLHGSGYAAQEYIPSKVYEYLLTGRPILALTPAESELGRMLRECGHQIADPDDPHAIAAVLAAYIQQWEKAGLVGIDQGSPFTVEQAVRQFLQIAGQIA
jgi:glycosyltransferase involved in cell wall biosynthesis